MKQSLQERCEAQIRNETAMRRVASAASSSVTNAISQAIIEELVLILVIIIFTGIIVSTNVTSSLV